MLSGHAVVQPPILHVLPLDIATKRGGKFGRAAVEVIGEEVTDGDVAHSGLGANLFASLEANKIACKRRKMLCVKTLAEQVLQFMQAEELNAPQMARLVGTSRQNIENLMAGNVHNPRYLASLARVMRTSADALLRGDFSPKSEGHPQNVGGRIPGQAQLLSPEAVTIPDIVTWELLMQSGALPSEFAVMMPDGALGDKVPAGTKMVFKRADVARPRQCVLVEDKEGGRYVRRYAQGAGGTWHAQALDDAYVSLHSETHGLRILAVMTLIERSEI
jgi:hypothetical protein